MFGAAMTTQTIVKTPNDTLSEWALVIGAGIFATGLAEPEVLGLPFRQLLANEILQQAPSGVDKAYWTSIFIGFIAAPWSLKIFSGLLLDSVPLFGTRRRSLHGGRESIGRL
jgi:hypothetical protein